MNEPTRPSRDLLGELEAQLVARATADPYLAGALADGWLIGFWAGVKAAQSDGGHVVGPSHQNPFRGRIR